MKEREGIVGGYLLGSAIKAMCQKQCVNPGNCATKAIRYLTVLDTRLRTRLEKLMQLNDNSDRQNSTRQRPFQFSSHQTLMSNECVLLSREECTVKCMHRLHSY